MAFSRSPFHNSTLQSISDNAGEENIPFTIVAPMETVVAGKPIAEFNKLRKDVNIKNVETLFGKTSLATKLFKAAYAVSPNHSIWVYPLGDIEAGVASETDLTITDVASDNGKIKLTLEGVIYETTFLKDATAKNIATALFDVIKDDTYISFTVSDDEDGKINFKNKQKGKFGNNVSFKIEIYNADGIKTNCGLTTNMPPFSGGNGLHDVSNLFTGDGILNYQTHIYINYDILKDNTVGISIINQVNERKKVRNKVLNGGIFSSCLDDEASLLTLQTNSKYINENIFLHKFPETANGEIKGNSKEILGVQASLSMLAIFNSKADVTDILVYKNQAKGNIDNAGFNMSGMKTPSNDYVIDPSDLNDGNSNYDEEEIKIWTKLGVNIWNIANGRYELMQAGLTSNSDEKQLHYNYFSVMVGIMYWQQREFNVLKIVNANGKSTRQQSSIAKGEIISLIRDFTTRGILNADAINKMIGSISSDIDLKSRIIALIYGIVPTLPLSGSDSLIQISSIVSDQDVNSTF